VPELVARLNDENLSNLVIMFIRLVTSAEIQRRADFFTPFILGMAETFMETEDFCRRYVECMGEESDHLQLVAVADAFQVRLYLRACLTVTCAGDAHASACSCTSVHGNYASSALQSVLASI
jgi:hypothetical protein